jgi:hypothetical protein
MKLPTKRRRSILMILVPTTLFSLQNICCTAKSAMKSNAQDASRKRSYAFTVRAVCSRLQARWFEAKEIGKNILLPKCKYPTPLIPPLMCSQLLQLSHMHVSAHGQYPDGRQRRTMDPELQLLHVDLTRNRHQIRQAYQHQIAARQDC